jgi:hypothetical protein
VGRGTLIHTGEQTALTDDEDMEAVTFAQDR